MMLLSHHRPEELHRTYAVGGVRICARCLGTYPVMLGVISLQLALGAPLAATVDPLVALLLAPALIDWAVGRIRPQAGSNAWRTITGVLLGVSMGRTLYVHFSRPFHPWLLAQGALVTAVALPVILRSCRRRPPG